MCTQAAEEAAESELAECQSTLRAAEEDCQAADQRTKKLQAHRPDETPPASGKRASGSAPRAPARSRKRAASEIEDRCASSPSKTGQRTQQQQPRTDPLPPRPLSGNKQKIVAIEVWDQPLCVRVCLHAYLWISVSTQVHLQGKKLPVNHSQVCLVCPFSLCTTCFLETVNGLAICFLQGVLLSYRSWKR